MPVGVWVLEGVGVAESVVVELGDPEVLWDGLDDWLTLVEAESEVSCVGDEAAVDVVDREGGGDGVGVGDGSAETE